MKKLLVLLIVLLLVSPALAATKSKKKKAKRVATPVSTPVETPEATPVATPVAKPVAETPTDHWVLQIQGGGNFILSTMTDAATVNSPGWGFDGSFGYAPDNTWTFSFLSGYEVFAITPPGGSTDMGISGAYTPLQIVTQCNLPGEDIRLYFLLGAGLALNSVTYDHPDDGIIQWMGYKENDFLLSPGLGIAFKLSDKTSLFIQGKLDLDFFSQTFADQITLITYSTKKFDTVQMFVPVQAGFSFSLN